MEGVQSCLTAINSLRGQLLGLATTEITSQPILLEEETNNNQLNEIPPLPSSLHLMSRQQIENGGVKEMLEQHFARSTSVKQTFDELKKSLLQLNQLNSIVAHFAVEADLEPQNQNNGYRSMMKINQILIRDLLLLLISKKLPNARTLRSYLYRVRLTVLINLVQLSWKAESDRWRNSEGHISNEPNLFHTKTALWWMELYQVSLAIRFLFKFILLSLFCVL